MTPEEKHALSYLDEPIVSYGYFCDVPEVEFKDYS